MLTQSDELARLRARMLTEAGEKRDTDVALEDLQAAMTGLQGLTEAQKAELRRLQALTESLQARAVRPRTPHMKLDVMIQGDAPQSHPAQVAAATQQQYGGNGRSLRDDLGCNLLFETLVLDMGYDAEPARQAIMAMPGSVMDDIIDYMIDKEAIFESWRRFKASLAAAA